ncbi:hypothetical protein [Sphingomonas sp. UYP23]
MSEPADGTAGREIEADVGRMQLPDWPRLMSLPLASAYFGVCAAKFRALEIRPVRIGRRVLWDRHDLDRFVDGMSGQPVMGADPVAVAKSMERRFYTRLKNERVKAVGP